MTTPMTTTTESPTSVNLPHIFVVTTIFVRVSLMRSIKLMLHAKELGDAVSGAIHDPEATGVDERGAEADGRRFPVVD